MADTKISNLAAVTDVLVGDEYVLARSGASKKITAADLAAGLSEALGIGVWTDYTPTLTGSVTNPTLGTASSIVGRYCSIGKLVVAMVQISFGTSGVAAGSGTYYVSVPVNFGGSAFSYARSGICLLYDSSVGSIKTGICERDAANHRLEVFQYDGTLVTASAPWTWAASDQIHLLYLYEST
jgi:hypothetical protein